MIRSAPYRWSKWAWPTTIQSHSSMSSAVSPVPGAPSAPVDVGIEEDRQPPDAQAERRAPVPVERGHRRNVLVLTPDGAEDVAVDRPARPVGSAGTIYETPDGRRCIVTFANRGAERSARSATTRRALGRLPPRRRRPASALRRLERGWVPAELLRPAVGRCIWAGIMPDSTTIAAQAFLVARCVYQSWAASSSVASGSSVATSSSSSSGSRLS